MSQLVDLLGLIVLSMQMSLTICEKLDLGHTEYKVELDQIYVEYEDALIGFYINERF